jgi:ferritin
MDDILNNFSLINNQMSLGLQLHRELADCFHFVSMHGYAMFHEHQVLEEGISQRKLKRYLITNYGVYLPDELPQSANLAKPLLSKHKREELQSSDVKSIVETCFNEHVKWEKSVLAKLEKIALTLLDNANMASYDFVMQYVANVRDELLEAKDRLVQLNAIEWDLTEIASRQEDWKEKYTKEIKKLS